MIPETLRTFSTATPILSSDSGGSGEQTAHDNARTRKRYTQPKCEMVPPRSEPHKSPWRLAPRRREVHKERPQQAHKVACRHHPHHVKAQGILACNTLAQPGCSGLASLEPGRHMRTKDRETGEQRRTPQGSSQGGTPRGSKCGRPPAKSRTSNLKGRTDNDMTQAKLSDPNERGQQGTTRTSSVANKFKPSAYRWLSIQTAAESI